MPKARVDEWIKEAQGLGIRSIICLLDDRQLKYYEKLPAGLVRYYKSKGMKVVHIAAPNMRKRRFPMNNSTRSGQHTAD